MTDTTRTKEVKYPELILIKDLESLKHEYERIIKSVNGVATAELKNALVIIKNRMMELEMAINILSDMKFI